jgi:HSF-type DNA-binding
MPPLESSSSVSPMSEDDSMDTTSGPEQEEDLSPPAQSRTTTRRRGSSASKRRNNNSGGGGNSSKPHIIAHHSYHDHSQDVHVDFSPPANNPSFPVKLHEMLIKTELDELQSVVSWMPHGRAFVVHSPAEFKSLLPNYFKLSKLASFQRQLNLYGFQRLTTGPDKNGYYHELFLRGRMDLVAQMHRIKVKGTGVRAKANPEEEPNLYAYPKIDGAGHVLQATNRRSASGPTEMITTEITTDEDEEDLQDVMDHEDTMTVEAEPEDDSIPVLPTSISPSNSEPSVATMDQQVQLQQDHTMTVTAPSSPLTRLRSIPMLLISAKDMFSSSNDADNESSSSSSSSSSCSPAAAAEADISSSSHDPKAIVNRIEQELGEVNFETLIEAMFTRNQTMTFADLQKLATTATTTPV